MKEEQSLHEKHPWSLLNDLSEQIDREAKRNNKIQRTYFSAHKKPFFIWEIIELAACPSWRKNIGDSNFLFLWNETLQERLARSSNEQILKNVSAEINSDVGEIFCGHSGQIPFTRQGRGGNMKTLSVSLNSNLAWGRRPRSEKATRCFLDSDWLIGLILDSDWL